MAIRMTANKRDVRVNSSGVVPEVGDKTRVSSLLVRSKIVGWSGLGDSRRIGISSKIRGKLGRALMYTWDLRCVGLTMLRCERNCAGNAIRHETCICNANTAQHGHLWLRPFDGNV